MYFDIYIDESRHLRMKEIGLKQRQNFERLREGLLEMALNSRTARPLLMIQFFWCK